MKVTGKHFPGHGAVTTDSHKSTATDARSRSEIENDMAVFNQLIELQKLDAIMPAHVIYPVFDFQPASGSVFWLKTVLKDRLGFKGIIFSDDLSMKGAQVLGNCTERILASLSAGCDMTLICNNRSGVIKAIDLLPQIQTDKPRSLFHKNNIDYNSLLKTSYWQQCHKEMQRLNELWETQISYSQT